MVTKKKSDPIAYEEPMQKKKKKKTMKDREATKEPELNEQSPSEIQKQASSKCKRRNSLAEKTATDRVEEQSAEISFKKKKKKKKKKSKLKEGCIPDPILCADDVDIDNLAPNCLAEKDEMLGKSKSLKKKKKSKLNEHDTDNNDVDVDNLGLNCLEPKEETLCKSKRSKKKKDQHVPHIVEVEDKEELLKPNANDVTSVKKRKRDSAAEETVRMFETVAENIVRRSEDTHDKVTKKKKKKKRRKEEEIVQPVATENGVETGECGFEEHNSSDICIKKKKVHRSTEATTVDREDTSLNRDTNESDKPKDKQNRKKHRPESALPKEKSTTIKKKNVQVKQEDDGESTKMSTENIVRHSEDTHDKVTKKKEKKKRHKEEEMVQPVATENGVEMGECGFEEQNNSDIFIKKKKVHRSTEATTVNNEDTSLNRDTNESDKPKDKQNRKKHIPKSAPPKEKLKSIKKKNVQVKQEDDGESTECDGDLQIVSVKQGNTDEIRRHALQAEVDRESGKIKDTRFGQWQTASFENSDQEMKFFRLMGGFKKSSQTSSAQPLGIEKTNMALSKTGVETLKQNLNSEFEKALDLKQHRGIGLGFQPAANKTFYIDKAKSKSIKFDD